LVEAFLKNLILQRNHREEEIFYLENFREKYLETMVVGGGLKNEI